MHNDGTLGADLGPHGTEFARPVILTMDLTGTSAEGQSPVSSTLWYNEENDWWETVAKIESEEPSQLNAALNHFSGYKANVGG